MKKMLKRLGAALMMLVLVMGLTACASEDAVEESSVDPGIVAQLEASCASIVESLGMLTEADIESFLASGDDFTVAAMTAWVDNSEELGAFVKILSTTVEMEGEMYMLTSDVAFEKADATVTMNYDATGMPTYMNIEVQYSLGELMTQAGLNTIMGLGVVFAVLIFLILVISLFKYIGKIAEGKTKKEAPKSAPAPVPAAAPVVEENLVDDGALVAVIAAAIAASENTSTDSFVVRSIRRKPNNKWSRA